ncbi:MAG: hypothetical protein K9W44_09625 [Candidatus Lokiarchaeota archaeon]|nr:hypothetical protein [Candidatus Harpocratesius repetitus]
MKIEENLKKNENLGKKNDLEFRPEFDPFARSRNKGPIFWILHHIFFKTNTIIIFSWLSLVTLIQLLYFLGLV